MTIRPITRSLIRPNPRPLVRVPAGGSAATMQSLIPSTTFDLDATQLLSYDGSSQTFSNATLVPSGGGSQTDYDVTLGADDSVSTDDPTFNGTAGTADARFTFDGADFMVGTTNAPNVVHSMQADGALFWIGIVGTWPDVLANNDIVFSSGDVSEDRVDISVRADGEVRVRQLEVGAGVSAQWNFPAVAVADTSFALIFTGDQTGDVFKIYNMSTTPVVSGTSWGSGLDAATTTPFSFGARPDGGSPMTNNFEIKAASLGNVLADDTLAGTWFDFMGTRHETDYTP